jgi:hypothetical protein
MANLYNVPLKNAVQKVLANTLLSSETGTITFTTSVTSELQASSTIPGILVVDRIDVNGNLTPTLTEYISFEAVSGSTVTTLARGLGGTVAQDHSIGAIVEFVPDVVWADAINDVFTEQHNADGTHKTLSNISLASVTINNPLIAGGSAISLALNYSNLQNVSIDGSSQFNSTIINASLASITISSGIINGASLASVSITGRTGLPATFRGLIQYVDAGTINLDLSSGNQFSGPIAGNRTFTVSNYQEGQAFIVRVFSSGGPYTPSWFSTIAWSGGVAPTLTANKTTVVGFLCTGSNTFDGYLVGTGL